MNVYRSTVELTVWELKYYEVGPRPNKLDGSTRE